jgi:AcrR family transcriptional regulator
MDQATDGRALIRSANRDKVVETLLAMFVEGTFREGDYDGIAARAGLSARTVYRFFEDRDAIYRIAITKYLDRIRVDLVISAIGEGSFDHRCRRFIDARIGLFAKHSPQARQLEHMAGASTSPLIRSFRGSRQEFLREQVRRQFAPELAALPETGATSTLALLDNAFQFESLAYFLDERGLSERQVRTLLSHLLRVTLAAAAVEESPQRRRRTGGVDSTASRAGGPRRQTAKRP